MSETKDRRRRIVPSVNTVRKKQPPPCNKADTPVAAKPPEIVGDGTTNTSSSDDGKIRVFVLSPAMLKQMGINVGSLQKGTSNNDIIKQAKKDHSKSKNDNSNESSSEVDHNSKSVKKTLYNKLKEKKNNKTDLPSIKSSDSDGPSSNVGSVAQIVDMSGENNVTCKETLKTYNLPESTEFRQPASPTVPSRLDSSNMETVSYVTSSLIMSPGEDISSYIAGYSNIPQAPAPSAESGNVTKHPDIQNCTGGMLDNCAIEKLSMSDYNIINENQYLHTTARVAEIAPDMNVSLDTINKQKMDTLQQRDVFSIDQKNNFNSGGVGLEIIGNDFPVHYSPSVVPQQFYNIQINPDVLVSDQIEFINSETPQICIDIGQSVSHQDDVTFTAIQSVPFSGEIQNNSFDQNDGQNISESNDESEFDYIIEDVNSDEIEKVDFMNVDLDLLQKETNESLENQSTYLCPIEVDTGLDLLDSKHNAASCVLGSQGLPPFEIISPISTIKKYLYSENSGSPNSSSIRRNMEYFLKSMDQNIEFAQQSDNYIENNYNFVPSDEMKVSKDFIPGDVSNHVETPSVIVHDESTALQGDYNISEMSKLQNITAMVIKSPNIAKSPNVKNTVKKTVAEVPVNLNNTLNKKDIRVYTKSSPKGVMKHSALNKQSSLVKVDDTRLNVSIQQGSKEVNNCLSLRETMLSTKDSHEKKGNYCSQNIKKSSVENDARDVSQSRAANATECVKKRAQSRKTEKTNRAIKKYDNLEENVQSSPMSQQAEPFHKIVDYLKQFHSLKSVKESGSKTRVDLETKKIGSIKPKKAQEKENIDKIMHGVEKPGGSETRNIDSTELPDLSDATINLCTETIVNDDNDGFINMSSRKLELTNKSKEDLVNKSNLDSLTFVPLSSACDTFQAEIFSYNNVATDDGHMDAVEADDTNRCILFEDSHDTTSPSDSYENAVKNSADSDENIEVNVKSQECGSDTKAQKQPVLEEQNMTRIKEMKTYSRIKYKKNDTELIDLPNTHDFNVVKINETKMENLLNGMQTDGHEAQQELPSTSETNTCTLAGDSGSERNEIIINEKNVSIDTELHIDANYSTCHLNEVHSNNLQDGQKLADVDIFPKVIDDPLKITSHPVSPSKEGSKDIEASPTLIYCDAFSSVIPKKRFSRMDGFIKEAQSNAAKESCSSAECETSTIQVDKVQYSQQDDIRKRITKASRKRFDTFVTDEVLQNDEHISERVYGVSHIVEPIVNDTPRVMENHILSFDPKSCNSSGVSEIIPVGEKNVVVESKCDSDLRVDDRVQSQIVEHDNYSLTLLNSQNLHNLELSTNQVEKNACHSNIEIPFSANDSNTIVESNDTCIKCVIPNEENNVPQMNHSRIVSGETQSNVTKLEEKIVCRPPKKIIIERVRIDLNISEANRINKETPPVSHHIPGSRITTSHAELLPSTSYYNKAMAVRDNASVSDTFSEKDFTTMEVVLQDGNEIICNRERIDSITEQAFPSKNNNINCNPIKGTNQTENIGDQKKESELSDVNILKMNTYNINQPYVVSDISKGCRILDINTLTDGYTINPTSVICDLTEIPNAKMFNMNIEDINGSNVAGDLKKENQIPDTLNVRIEDINMNTDDINQSDVVSDLNTSCQILDIISTPNVIAEVINQLCEIPQKKILNEDFNMDDIDQSSDLCKKGLIPDTNVNDVKVKESRRKAKAIPSKIKSYLKMKATKTNAPVQKVHSTDEGCVPEGRKAEADQTLLSENAECHKTENINNNCHEGPCFEFSSKALTDGEITHKIGDIVQINSENSAEEHKKSPNNPLNCTFLQSHQYPLNMGHVLDPNIENGIPVDVIPEDNLPLGENVTNKVNVVDSHIENTSFHNVTPEENTERSKRNGHISDSSTVINVFNIGSVESCVRAAGGDVDCSDSRVDNGDPGSVNSVNHDSYEQTYTSCENFDQASDICYDESMLEVSSNITVESSFYTNKSAQKRKRVSKKEPKKKIENSSRESVSEVNNDNVENTTLNSTLLSERRESDDDCPLSEIQSKDQHPKRGRPVKTTGGPLKNKGRPPKQLKIKRPSKPPKKKKLGKDVVTCAVCSVTVNRSDWSEHSLNIHKYLAWQEGETPLDVENEQVQIQAFTRAKKETNLICDKCGEYRASVVGYISHISMCQKTEEEINALRQPCPICNRIMLPQSLKVHLSTHSRAVTVDVKENDKESIPLTDDPGGRKKRKAAETAGETFKKLKTDMEYLKEVKDLYKKPWCGRAIGIVLSMWKKQIAAGGDAVCGRCKHPEKTMETIINHYTISCPLIPSKLFECKVCKFQCEKESDMCDHIKVNHGSALKENKDDSCSENNHSGVAESDSSCSEASDIDEVVKPSKKSRPKVSKIQNETPEIEEWKPSDSENKCYLPSFDFGYCFKYPRNVYRMWNKEFIATHYSKERLFHDMGCNVYRGLGIAEAEEYFPECKESCSMANSTVSSRDKSFQNNDVVWHKYKLFESNLSNGVQTFWCGGPVWAMNWVPGDRKDCYLAVAPDRFIDFYYQEDVFYTHKGLIQIWNTGNLSDKEKGCTDSATMVMSLAHNGGVVWDMSWCPSGCDDDCRDTSELEGPLRMGLLAVACSDGRTYIYAIANPSSLPASESKAYITEPVAVLKLSREDAFTLGRGQYQATKVFWSKEKGHNIIAVGYTSGVVALYNVGASSRLLQSRRGNTAVYLPFHNSQPQRTCITGLVLLPPLKSFEGPMMCVTSNAGCSVWSGSNRLYWRRGQFSGAALAEQWPQVIAFTEELQPKSGGASTIPFRVSGGQMDKITMTESGVLRGCVVPWSGALLGLGQQGQLTARRHRTPFISRDRKSSLDAKNPVVLWYPEIVDLKKGSEQSGDAQSKKPEKKNKNNLIEDFAKSFEEARENYGILFVNKPKNNRCLEDRYSVSAWPLWESLSVCVPSGTERHNFNAVGGRAGQCRVSLTPDCSATYKSLTYGN